MLSALFLILMVTISGHSATTQPQVVHDAYHDASAAEIGNDQYTIIQGARDHQKYTEVPKGVRVRLRNGTVVEMYPTPTAMEYNSKKGTAKELPMFIRGGGGGGFEAGLKKDEERGLLSTVARDGRGGFRMCSRCRCCAPGSSTLCIRLPCCFSITCASPNQPFGVCSLTPFSCNCFSC